MYVNKHSELPKTPFWAILSTSATHIPGDERSRTNPGHGYPAHTVNSISMEVFTKEAEWKKAIARKVEDQTKYGLHGNDFFACFINPATISTQISVDVKTT